MRRVILHWTGGAHYPNPKDLQSYHALVDVQGGRRDGVLAPEANLSTKDGVYARHAGQFNTGSIGIAMCGMLGAREVPFSPGSAPISRASFDEAVQWSAEFCKTYGIKVSRNTVMTHAEVLPRFGRGIYKWDVTWLPGMADVGDAVEIGDYYRARVQAGLDNMVVRRPKWFWGWVKSIGG